MQRAKSAYTAIFGGSAGPTTPKTLYTNNFGASWFQAKLKSE
jgi:hypothetical protein